MTTQIKIDAHCPPTMEVLITTSDVDDRNGYSKSITIQDGESHTCYVYDGREITIREIPKL